MPCGCGKKKKIVGLFSSGRPLRKITSHILVNEIGIGGNSIEQTNESPSSSSKQNQHQQEDIEYISDISPSDWGPLLWKLFHITAERIGNTGVVSLDRDEAFALTFVIENIQNVLPCSECQAHAGEYIRKNPVTALKIKKGAELQNFARNYFLNFHNSVRERTGKPIIVTNVEDCKNLYMNEVWQKCEMDQLVEFFSFGVHHGIIKADIYKRWMTQYHKLRLIAGF